MYLHLGQDTVIRDGDVVGVFDLEITSQSFRTRAYLNGAEKRREVESVTQELPKAFVVAAPRHGKGRQRVYLTQLSSATLLRRSESRELG